VSDATVKTKFTADAQSAERVIAQLEKKYLNLENRLTQLSRKSKQGAEEGLSGFLKQAMTIDRVGAAVGSLANAYVGLISYQSNLRMEAERTAIVLDETIRKYRIQQGLQALSGEDSRQLATTIGTEAGVSQGGVLRIARQLESSGFSDPLRSGTAKAVIATLQATAQDVETAPLEEIVSSFAQQLNASGQDRSAANLLKLGVQFRGMFATSLEATDLPDFAKVRGLATQVGVSQEEFFGSAAVVRDVMNAAEGSTGLGNFFSKLAAPKPNQLKALETLGVNPADVDFVGESILDISKRLNQAVQALPEEQRVKSLAGLFGAEKSQLGAADALLRAAGSGRFAEYIGMAGDESAFEFSVREARGGPAAANRRLQAQIEEEKARLLEGGGIPETTLGLATQLENLRARRMMTEQGETLKLMFYDLMESGSRGVGLPSTSTRGSAADLFAEQALSRGGDFSLKDLRDSLDRNTAETKRQNDLIENRQPAVNRQAHTEQ
jgi:TP901 family phage tail tape measure protein